jgi:hypothetical protein
MSTSFISLVLAQLREATCVRQHASESVSMRQHTSAYVIIRQHTSAYELWISFALVQFKVQSHLPLSLNRTLIETQ